MAKEKESHKMILLLSYFFGLALACQYIFSAHSSAMVLIVHNTRDPDTAQPPCACIGAQAQKEERTEENSTAVAACGNWKPQKSSIPIKNMSVLHYTGCCGLGHRLGRQAAAWHLAHKLGFKLDVDWNACGGNIFDHFFSPEDEMDLAYVNSTYEMYKIRNDVPGFSSAHTLPRNMGCVQDELQSYSDMYTSMKRRFKGRNAIDSFVQDNFEGRFAIGIHIRAGNGEKGHFTSTGRQMNVTHESYTQHVSKRLVELLKKSNNNTLPPVLFVATDTAKYVGLFRKELEGIMPVVAWHQEHEAEGTGVFFGQHAKGRGQLGVDTNECLQKWKDMMSDMILLASTDLLIAGHYSSFSQTMPLSLVMGKHKVSPHAISESYCEVYEQGMDLTCYSSQMDWCHQTKHKLEHRTIIINDHTFNVSAQPYPVLLKELYSTIKHQKKTGR